MIQGSGTEFTFPEHPLAGPAIGQLSAYRRFYTVGDSVVYARDTLLAEVGAVFPDSFTYIERVCPENYLDPDPEPPYPHVLQTNGRQLRAVWQTGLVRTLPTLDNRGMELYPEGEILAFRGYRPPENLDLSQPLHGRRVGFASGKKIFDTVSVRVEKDPFRPNDPGVLRYWIYMAREGMLRSARVDAYGEVSGWERLD